MGEEWDKLAQNPFLAFYQRWPWFAQHTPLLNLWKLSRRHSRRFYCFCFWLVGFLAVAFSYFAFFCFLSAYLTWFWLQWCVEYGAISPCAYHVLAPLQSAARPMSTTRDRTPNLAVITINYYAFFLTCSWRQIQTPLGTA